MSIEQIVSQLPMGDIAQQLGVDENVANQAVGAALPALLAGLGKNANTPSGAEALTSALGGHAGALLDGGVNLSDVDPQDGQKILGHVFGDNIDSVTTKLGALGGNNGVNEGLMKKLLPILAPIVLAYLAKQIGGNNDQGGVGGVLGQVLNQAIGGNQKSSQGSDLLGSVLGSLLKQ